MGPKRFWLGRAEHWAVMGFDEWIGWVQREGGGYSAADLDRACASALEDFALGGWCRDLSPRLIAFTKRAFEKSWALREDEWICDTRLSACIADDELRNRRGVEI